MVSIGVSPLQLLGLAMCMMVRVGCSQALAPIAWLLGAASVPSVWASVTDLGPYLHWCWRRMKD